MGVLVICIGNKSRGDDGAARRTATLLEPQLPDGVRLISQPQLDIVMADYIDQAERVIFVDAERRRSPLVQVGVLEMAHEAGFTPDAHSLSPEGLMILTSSLYGDAPRAHLVSLAAPEMGHGEGLSQTAKAASEEAAFAVLGLLARIGSDALGD